MENVVTPPKPEAEEADKKEFSFDLNEESLEDAQQPVGIGSLTLPTDKSADGMINASAAADVHQQAEKMSAGMDVKKLALKKRPHPDL